MEKTFISTAFDVFVLVAICAYIGFMWWKSKKEKNQSPTVLTMIKGMVRVDLRALTATPLLDNSDFITFPSDLEGFIGDLKPREMSATLLEFSTGPMTERKKDIARVVTIAAAMYDFRIPYDLLCLDARTHALYRSLLGDIMLFDVPLKEGKDIRPSMTYLRKGAIDDVAEEHYVQTMELIGSILMHYAMKGKFPSFRNFAATFKRNRRPDDKRVYSFHHIGAMATAYAAITKIQIPRSYLTCGVLAESIVNAALKGKSTPASLNEIDEG